MYMQETLHMWYLSSAALALKACDDLAMGNRTGPTRSHLHRNFRTCRRKKVNVGFWILRQNHIGLKKIEIGVLRRQWPTELLGRVCLYPQNVQRGFHTIIPSEDQGNQRRAQGPPPLNQAGVLKGSSGCKSAAAEIIRAQLTETTTVQKGSYTGQHEVQG